MADYFRANRDDCVSVNEHKFYDGMAKYFVCMPVFVRYGSIC
jgi:hypothetical protein